MELCCEERHQSACTDPQGLVQRIVELERKLARQLDVERGLREDEARMRQALEDGSRMQAVGRLADGVAHDFNNLLGVIQGHAELVLRRMEPEHQERPRVAHILEATRRAAGLTRHLLSLSRRQPADPEVLQVGAVLEDIAGLLRGIAGNDAVLELGAAPGGWPIRAERAQIEQLVLHLVASRTPALNGGSLSIGHENRVLEGSGRDDLGLGPGRYVAVTVTDTAGGTESATETDGGLAVAHRMAQRAGGAVEVVRSVEAARVTVYLPAVEQPSADAADQPGAGPRAQTILLVEDDERLRVLLEELLQDQGRAVLSASNALEALSIASEHEGPIDLLLTDIVMPGMNGRRLAATVRRQRAETRVLYMSGYADAAGGEGEDADGGTPLLQKPFTGEALAQGMREALLSVPA